MSAKTFHFEMTDTFGGEMNYCWIERFTVKAKTELGAIRKLSKETGFNFRKDGFVYRAKRACIAAYILEHEIDQDWIDKAEKI